MPAPVAVRFWRRRSIKPYGIFILTMWAVMTVAAIGLNLTLGYAGQISLAQAAFVGIGAYITAYLTTRGWPFWSTYLLGAVSCFAIGWLLGYPALRVQHHYLGFVTLAFNTLVYLIFRNEEWLTGGIYGISNVPRPHIAGWSMNGPREFYYFCLAHLLVSLATWWLIRSPWGRASWPCAKIPCGRFSLGVDTRRYTLMAFALGAGLGGISCALRATCAIRRSDAVGADALAQSAADGRSSAAPDFSSDHSSARWRSCCPNGCVSQRLLPDGLRSW